MSEKIKVLQAMDIYLPDVDGVVNCMHNYSLNMCDKVELLNVVPKNRKDYVDDFPYEVLRCNSVRVPILNDYYGFPSLDKKFENEVIGRDFDIIHVHSPFNMAKFALKIAKKKNVPIVGTFHSNMRPIFKSLFGVGLFTEQIVHGMGKLYNQFDEMFVCSEPVAEQLRSFGYTGKISYLPFGTDFEKCDKVGEYSEKANEIFDIAERELVFLYLGRIMKLKRIDFILRSLKLVKDRGIKFRFFAVGKGAELEKLKKLSLKLGFSEKEVNFTGFLPREQLPLISARADLLLFPSLYDNFGLVKLECASYETAGVFIKGSCAGTDIIDGENGFLSEDNEESFAEKIIEAAKDYDRLKSIGKNAQDSLYIHWKDCTDVLLKNYERVIREKKEKDDNKK